MDDFVGPSRFQWPDEDLELAYRIRSMLPDRFHSDPRDPASKLDNRVLRPSVEHMRRTDPTEAADSARILGLVRTAFPEAEIIPTGGLVYHLALNDVLGNFGAEDEALLAWLLLLDETLAMHGRTQYAVALARKP